jgi:hypothetical protein
MRNVCYGWGVENVPRCLTPANGCGCELLHLTLSSEYGMHHRKPLPVSMSTVLFYLSHLSQEGEVREGSLNQYLSSVNQMHQDTGFRRPALCHYVDIIVASAEGKKELNVFVRNL